MVKDHQRAEDVTQEVFVSALRRMRATERPIAFKPWIYEIAKNACIDQFRRSKRAEEISYDADEGLAPADYGRLVSKEPVPDAALAAKQQLDHMVGAFGGLSEAHHQILVLRELEGLSYREIGERMGMSRPAVESTLFRARRRLSEEYDELASGERCLRVQGIITTAATGRLGARDTRRLARHVAHCQPCRRQALAAGVDEALVARPPIHRRAAEKVAALFPIPLLVRFRREGTADGWTSQLPVVSDHAAAGGAKLAAVAALVVAGLGAGVGTQVVHRDAPAADRPARVSERTSERSVSSAPAKVSAAAESSRDRDRDGGRDRSSARRQGGSSDRVATTKRRSGGLAEGGQGSAPAAQGGGTGAPSSPGAVKDATSSVPSTPSSPSTSTPSVPQDQAPSPQLQLPQVQLPEVTIPQSGGGGGEPALPQVDLSPTVDSVGSTVQGVTDGVNEATAPVTQPLEDATGINLP
jgi:RNA polymerase sigma factor (sigma-70 family)